MENRKSNLKLVGLELTYVGERDISTLRGRQIHLSSKDIYKIEEAAAIDGLDSLDLNIGKSTLTDSFSNAEIAEGWETPRFLVYIITAQRIGNIMEYNVLQGFTQHFDVINVNGEYAQFDPNGIIELNKISTYRTINGSAPKLYYSTNILLDRYGNYDGLYVSKPENFFSHMYYEKTAFQDVENNSILLGEDLESSGTANVIDDSLIGGLIETSKLTAKSQLEEGNNMEFEGIASVYAAEASAHSNAVISDIVDFYIDDVNISINPSFLRFDYLLSLAGSPRELDKVLELNVGAMRDYRYVKTEHGEEQLPLDSNRVEIRLNTQIAEIVGHHMLENNMKSLSASFKWVPKMYDPNLPAVINDSFGFSAIFDGLEEFVMNLEGEYARQIRNKTISDIGADIDKLLHEYDGYFLSIEVLGSAFCEVKLGIGTGVICSTHSMFADSLYSSVITDEESFFNNTRVADKISDTVFNVIKDNLNDDYGLRQADRNHFMDKDYRRRNTEIIESKTGIITNRSHLMV